VNTSGSNCLTERNILYLIINKNNKIKVMSKVKSTTTAKRGRPTVAGSKRQAVLAMRQAKRDQGLEIKRGRPAGTKKTTDITVEVKAKAPKASKATKQAALVDAILNGTISEA
jgi:hypothetical protein